jgi:hypothetical protein
LLRALDRLDIRAIAHAPHATRAGTLPFPEIVAKLIAAGVGYYYVDHVALCKQFYDGAGGRERSNSSAE